MIDEDDRFQKELEKQKLEDKLWGPQKTVCPWCDKHAYAWEVCSEYADTWHCKSVD